MKHKKILTAVVTLVIIVSGLICFYTFDVNNSRYNKEALEKVTLASTNIENKEDRKQKLENFKVLKDLVNNYKDDKKVNKKTRNKMKEIVKGIKDSLVKTYDDQINTIDTDNLDGDIDQLNEYNKSLSEVKNQILDEKEYGVLNDEEITKYNDKINIKMQAIDSKIESLENEKKEEEKRKAEEAKVTEEQAQQSAPSQGNSSPQSSGNAVSGTPAQQGGGSSQNQQGYTAPSNGSSSNKPAGDDFVWWHRGNNTGYTIYKRRDGSYYGVDANGNKRETSPEGWITTK